MDAMADDIVPSTPQALLAAVREIDRASDFAGAEAGLNKTARAIGMPVLAVSPNVSWPSFDPTHGRLPQARRVAGRDPVDLVGQERHAQDPALHSSVEPARCLSSRATSAGRRRAGRSLQKIAQAMTRMDVRSLITLPVHLPRGQIGMVTLGGAAIGEGRE